MNINYIFIFVQQFKKMRLKHPNSKYIILSSFLFNENDGFQFDYIQFVIKNLKKIHKNKKSIYDRWKCILLPCIKTKLKRKMLNIVQLLHYLTIINSQY
jgi:hypothetical protein